MPVVHQSLLGTETFGTDLAEDSIMSAETLLDRLEKVRRKGDGKWMACCPAHDDKNPSLSITGIGNGKVLIHCFAGCSPADVVRSLGLSMSDLYPPNPDIHLRHRSGYSRHHADTLRSIREPLAVVVMAANLVSKGEALSDANKEHFSRSSR